MKPRDHPSEPEVRTDDYQENEALGNRPVFSIRTRLIAAFALIFALCAVITVWTMLTLSDVQTKLHFLEVSGNYLAEIQQARRFEKNYLLYSTNLADAQEHVGLAKEILVRNRRTIQEMLGRTAYRTMEKHLADYEDLLAEINPRRQTPDRGRLELALRAHGARMVSNAQQFVRKEREEVDKLLRWARRVPFIFLGLLFLAMLVVAFFLSRQILGTLARFMDYTSRIGLGDFSPIRPARKYRDEFSSLAVAFNRMIHELDRRHRILVESHKLRAVGTLVAGVAHELNNPLNNNMLTACMLKEDFTEIDDEEKLCMIDDLVRETERAQTIVSNLLDFARQSETEIRPLPLTELLIGAVKLVGNQIKLAKVSLQTDFTEDLPPVHGDEQQIQQVFINLLLNAADALGERGEIRLSTHRADKPGFVVVEVADNGPGVPEHIKQRIFEPFFTTKRQGSGTGLGLSVSQGIVRRLGGTIDVTSRRGEGTTFSVLLPTTEVPSELRREEHGND